MNFIVYDLYLNKTVLKVVCCSLLRKRCEIAWFSDLENFVHVMPEWTCCGTVLKGWLTTKSAGGKGPGNRGKKMGKGNRGRDQQKT